MNISHTTRKVVVLAFAFLFASFYMKVDFAQADYYSDIHDMIVSERAQWPAPGSSAVLTWCTNAATATFTGSCSGTTYVLSGYVYADLITVTEPSSPFCPPSIPACPPNSPYTESNGISIANYCKSIGVNCPVGKVYVSALACNSAPGWKPYGAACTAPGCGGCGCVNPPFPPVNGSCKISHFGCNTGAPASQATGGTSWTWSCNGTNGGSNAPCSQPQPNPNGPSIIGPSLGFTNVNYTYKFTATDARSPADTIRYAIDWDNNGTIDQYSAYLPSGTQFTQTNSWAGAGTKTFNVRTETAGGRVSGWVPYSVQISLSTYTVSTNPGVGTTVSPLTQSVTQGNTAIFTVSAAPGYNNVVASGCGGSLAGTTYTTGPINGLCTVVASASAIPPLLYVDQPLEFGDVAVSTTLDRTMLVRNDGGGTLTGTVTISNSGSGVFTLIGSSVVSRGVGQSQIYTIRYAPAALGVTSIGQVTVTTNGGTASYSLKGTAVTKVTGALQLNVGDVPAKITRYFSYKVRNNMPSAKNVCLMLPPDSIYTCNGGASCQINGVAGGANATFLIGFKPPSYIQTYSRVINVGTKVGASCVNEYNMTISGRGVQPEFRAHEI